MSYRIRDARHDDGTAILEIYNYFVTKTWSSYLEEPVGQEWFEHLWLNVPDYPVFVAEQEGRVIAWALAKPYSTLSRKRRTAEISYFVLPGFQGQGLGKAFLRSITGFCQGHGFSVLLASIMGVNEQSIGFHEKMGFTKVGTMHRVIEKWGKVVDMVWMEKYIGE